MSTISLHCLPVLRSDPQTLIGHILCFNWTCMV